MIERIPEKRIEIEPLNWRKILPSALVAAFDSVQFDDSGRPDETRYKDVAMTLDRIAQAAAHRGVDVDALAKTKLDKIEQQVKANTITEGQAELMRDENDAVLQLINWARDEGLIDPELHHRLREAIN